VPVQWPTKILVQTQEVVVIRHSQYQTRNENQIIDTSSRQGITRAEVNARFTKLHSKTA